MHDAEGQALAFVEPERPEFRVGELGNPQTEPLRVGRRCAVDGLGGLRRDQLSNSACCWGGSRRPEYSARSQRVKSLVVLMMAPAARAQDSVSRLESRSSRWDSGNTWLK
jgi:hypothetical protein